MADVSRDRAQLMVVGAIALAVALVAVGLVLNFSIYTENLATREGNSGASSIVHDQQATVDGVGRAIEYVNVHVAGQGHDSPSNIRTQLHTQVAAINDSLAQVGGVSGASMQVTDVEAHVGARLADQNHTRDYLNESEVKDWRLVDGASDVGRFTMHVSRPSLADTSLSVVLGDIYHVKVTNETGATWKTYIYRDSTTGTAYLATADPSDSLGGLGDIVFTCASVKRNVTVDFVAGEFGDTDCDQLDYFTDNFDAPYTVDFVNGDQAGGTFEILINSTNYAAGNFHDPSLGKSPYAHNAAFTADVTFEYVGNDVRYRDTKRISPTPNVTRFPGLAPKVLEFDVSEDTDGTSGSVSYDVSWHVRDQDEDLHAVNVTLIDETDRNEVDEVTNTSVPSDGGRATLTVSHTYADTDHTFAVRVRATDENGNVVARTVKRDDK